MSNLGFRLAMAREGVDRRRDRGRRPLRARGDEGRRLLLGGEQSGHVIMLDHATTGDGTLTALHLLARVAGDRASRSTSWRP